MNPSVITTGLSTRITLLEDWGQDSFLQNKEIDFVQAYQVIQKAGEEVSKFFSSQFEVFPVDILCCCSLSSQCCNNFTLCRLTCSIGELSSLHSSSIASMSRSTVFL